MTDFLEEMYEEHYPQTRQYALGVGSKYANILITDRRPRVKTSDIGPSAPENCMILRKNEEDNLW